MPEYTGIIHKIGKNEYFGKNNFRKRELILTDGEERFAAYVPFEFTRDDCDLLDGLKLGETVTVTYQLGGRLWQKDRSSPERCFASIVGLSVSEMSGRDEGARDEPPEDEIPF